MGNPRVIRFPSDSLDRNAAMEKYRLAYRVAEPS
jgi:hypothetical protein